MVFALSFLNLNAGENSFIVRDIIITGNNKTKEAVILRECPFNKSDTITLVEAEELLGIFNNNLIKTSLFNFVNTSYITSSDSIDILVSVEERWYLWPYPILEYADRNLSSYIYNRDFTKLNYGLAFDIYNFRGQNDLLKFKIRSGYKEHYSVAWHKNATGPRRKSGVNIQADYFRQKSTEYKVEGNKPVFISDDKIYLRKIFNAGINYIYRPGLEAFFNVGLRYQNSVFENNLLFPELNTPEPGYKSNYLKPYLYFKFDSRDNKVYPVDGLLIEAFAGYNQSLESETASFFIFNVNAKFNRQIANSRFSFHTEPSYSLMKPIGEAPVLFDNKLEFSHDFWIRGYEYFYFFSPGFFNSQNTISYKISDFKIHNLPSFLPDEFSKTYTRVYLDAFFDYAYSWLWNEEDPAVNPMSGKSVFSSGLGVSFETYYDRLLQIYVAYVGYSAKTGIFVNYKTPIYKLY